RGVVRVAEAEVAIAGIVDLATDAEEGVQRVFRNRDGLVRATRSVWNGLDADGHGASGRIGVGSTILQAAVVLHLEGEAVVIRAVRVSSRHVGQETIIDVADRNGGATANGRAVELQVALGGSGANDHSEEVIATGVNWAAAAGHGVFR